MISNTRLLATVIIALALPHASRAQATVTLLSYKATVPVGWVTAPSSSSMRLAQYSISGRDGSVAAEVVVYFFGEGQGGERGHGVARGRGQGRGGLPRQPGPRSARAALAVPRLTERR